MDQECCSWQAKESLESWKLGRGRSQAENEEGSLCPGHRSQPAVTAFREHLLASDMGSPKRGRGEEPSSAFNKFIPNGSSGEGLGWWSPTFPARPWLCHLHLLKAESALPFLPTSSEHCPRLLGHSDKSCLQDTGPGEQHCSGCSLQSQAHVVPNSLQPCGILSLALWSAHTVFVFPELPWQRSPPFLVRAKKPHFIL